MVEYNQFSILVDHPKMVRQIIRPGNLDTSDSVQITGIEDPFEFYLCICQSRRSAEIVMDKILKRTMLPDELPPSRKSTLEGPKIDHKKDARGEIDGSVPLLLFTFLLLVLLVFLLLFILIKPVQLLLQKLQTESHCISGEGKFSKLLHELKEMAVRFHGYMSAAIVESEHALLRIKLEVWIEVEFTAYSTTAALYRYNVWSPECFDDFVFHSAGDWCDYEVTVDRSHFFQIRKLNRRCYSQCRVCSTYFLGTEVVFLKSQWLPKRTLLVALIHISAKKKA